MEAVPQGHEAAAALRTANNKSPQANARPWPRGASSSSSAAHPPPPKVYRVEPREFRDLVQRLTGAPPTALRRPQKQHQQLHHQRAGVAGPPVVQPQPVRAAEQQQAYGAAAAPWFSFPMAGGVEAQPQQQQQHGGAFR